MSSLFQICNSLSFMLSWFENSPGKKILHKMGFLEFKKMCCASNDKILFPVNNSGGLFV